MMNNLAFRTIASTPMRCDNGAKRKILRYAAYGKGWYFGEGSPPSAKILGQALALLEAAHAYSFFVDSALGVDGEIELVVYHDNDRLQFIITENNEIEFGHERKSDLSRPFLPEDETEEVCYEERITFNDAMTKINNLGREICTTTSTSALSNQSGYTGGILGSAAVHSEIRQMGQGSLAFRLVA
ncbi:MAG: hypothetical protein L7F77_11545 [Candidatus Magnetominusculus sp. LBB02]|nr:hypothetical protein [Candidatus Magnetominusculus sp. LBB02]